MEKKFASLVLIFLLVALLPSFVNAQTSNLPSRLKQKVKDNDSIIRKEGRISRKVSQIKEGTKAIVQAKRDEFKTRIQTIKDEKKKALVARIDGKLSEVNIKHTDRFSQVLTKLQTHLDKISQTAKDKKVLADVGIAQASIDAAETAVANQAAKTYTIQITTETALRLNVGTTTSQLRQDLMSTHKLVVDAKQAVQALNKDNVIIKKEPASSANL